MQGSFPRRSRNQLPIPNILCQNFRMNRLLILPVLLLTLLVGTPASSADFQTGLTAYESGNFATALREWTPLAEQGNARAQYNLGLMYENGYGVPKNYKTAMKWYRLAVDQGNTPVLRLAGVHLNQLLLKVLVLRKWTPLAEQGDADAQYNLGMSYRDGQGVLQDYKAAVRWFRLAAEQGLAAAGPARLLSRRFHDKGRLSSVGRAADL
jgi:TPR repeat protein